MRQKNLYDVNQNNLECGVESKKRKLAFLDLLLQFELNGKSLSDEDVREEVRHSNYRDKSIKIFEFFLG